MLLSIYCRVYPNFNPSLTPITVWKRKQLPFPKTTIRDFLAPRSVRFVLFCLVVFLKLLKTKWIYVRWYSPSRTAFWNSFWKIWHKRFDLVVQLAADASGGLILQCYFSPPQKDEESESKALGSTLHTNPTLLFSTFSQLWGEEDLIKVLPTQTRTESGRKKPQKCLPKRHFPPHIKREQPSPPHSLSKINFPHFFAGKRKRKGVKRKWKEKKRLLRPLPFSPSTKQKVFLGIYLYLSFFFSTFSLLLLHRSWEKVGEGWREGLKLEGH